jgi:hypothetical protein
MSERVSFEKGIGAQNNIFGDIVRDAGCLAGLELSSCCGCDENQLC